MTPSIHALLGTLREAEESEAERTIDALIARGKAVWPELSAAISEVRGDSTDMVWSLRLQRVYVALPAPLDAQLLFASTAKQWSAARFVDVLVFNRVEEVVASSLRFLRSEHATEREVGVSLLHQLVPRFGAMRYNTVEARVTLDRSAEAVLAEALRRGEDAYVIAQILIRHGWMVDEALAALRDAVEDRLRRDQQVKPDDVDGLSYDLGCDLQVVATTLLHAGDAAQAHVDLFDQMYEGGDGPLRSVVLESIAGVGGEASLACVRRWMLAYPEYRTKLAASLPSYEVGFRLGLDAALALLEGRPGAQIIEALLPRAHTSIFAGHTLHRFFLRVHATDPDGVEAFLRQASRSEVEELARSAEMLLDLLDD